MNRIGIGNKTKSSIFILAILVGFLASGCRDRPTDIPTATPAIFPKRPEPHTPLVKGRFSGLPDNTLVTIRIATPSGQEVQWGTRRGNGAWEAVLPEKPDVDYIVTAEAAGYISNPINYPIHVDEIGLVRSRDGSVAELDFDFQPIAPAISKPYHPFAPLFTRSKRSKFYLNPLH
jgi:hypothetical protein